jgi:hypothetical protein
MAVRQVVGVVPRSDLGLAQFHIVHLATLTAAFRRS